MHRLKDSSIVGQRNNKKKKDHQRRSVPPRGRPPARLSLVGFWAFAASAPQERSEQLEWSSDSCQNKERGFNGGKRWLIESGGSSSCMGGHTRCARQQTRTVQVLLHEEMFFTAILLTMREATRRQPANIKTNKLGLQGLHLLTPSLILQPLSLVLNCVLSRGDWMGSLGFTLHHPQKDPPPFLTSLGGAKRSWKPPQKTSQLIYLQTCQTAFTLKFGLFFLFFCPFHPTVNSNYLTNCWWTKRTL